MKNDWPELKVFMLGRFSVIYGDQQLSLGKSNTTKAMKLLQLLLASSEQGGIQRSRILEDLYGREEVADTGNNLRVTLHRLKKLLADSELPEFDYIQMTDGLYQWKCPMPLYLDIHEFTSTLKEAEEKPTQEERIQCLERACRIYRGEFLPMMSGEEWVIISSVSYKAKYSKALSEVGDYLIKKKEYARLLELVETAAQIYPFDEWQIYQMEALAGLNRHKEAFEVYRKAEQMFMDELGITPSENMKSCYEHIGRKQNDLYRSVDEIKERLGEEDRDDGAYYISLPGFRDGYRLVRRIIERNGESVFLMVCAITDGKKGMMENEEKLAALALELQSSIKHSLRRGDSFTQYSPSQFLVLLVGTSRENCAMIFDRIARRFSSRHKSWERYLNFYVSSVADVENNKSRISFSGNEFHCE